jgi:formylglycine-generating enzyme required for sulfatase activity
VAQDGDGDHSPFTAALADVIRRPGLGLFDTFNEIGLRVKRTTGAQQPWVSSSPIAGQFYFAGLPAAKETPRAGGQPVSPAADAAQVWRDIQGTTSLAVLDDFIRRFGDAPIYGPRARERREEVAKGQAREPAKEPAKVAMVVDPARSATPLTTAQERALKRRDSFKECADCPEMVVVPAGSFTMGSPKDEWNRNSDEDPQHVVRIRQPFAVGKLHVTRDQFAAFANETRFAAPGCDWRNPGFAQEGSHPVVCVNWDDANAYANWLAKKTGKPYRLLSEAEWEYAARGRTSPGSYPRFWFGDNGNDLCWYGNFVGSDAGCNDGYDRTSPAGHYAPNAFGLYDMFGNAWQWTADCYHDSYNGAPADGSPWTTGSCNGRVVRGGSWGSLPRELRAAFRSRYTFGDDVFGFRVARTLTP